MLSIAVARRRVLAAAVFVAVVVVLLIGVAILVSVVGVVSSSAAAVRISFARLFTVIALWRFYSIFFVSRKFKLVSCFDVAVN